MRGPDGVSARQAGQCGNYSCRFQTNGRHVILLLAVMHTHRRRNWQPSCKEAASNADGIVSSHSCCHIRVKGLFLFLAINWQEYLREGSRSLLWRHKVQMERLCSAEKMYPVKWVIVVDVLKHIQKGCTVVLCSSFLLVLFD